MYVMEYLLYHLRPYGIDSRIRFEKEESTTYINENKEENDMTTKNTNVGVKIDSEDKTMKTSHISDKDAKVTQIDIIKQNETDINKTIT